MHNEHENLFIQLKRGTYGFSRTHEVNENETIADFVDGMIADLRTEDYYGQLPRTWRIEFTAKRQTFDEDSTALVKSILDGGEVVTARIYDDEGCHRVPITDRDPETGEW